MAKAKKGLADLADFLSVEVEQAAPLRIADLDRSERLQRAAALISAALGFEVEHTQIEYVPFSLTSSAKEGWYYYPIPDESREIVRTARSAADTGTDRFWRVNRPGFQSAFCGPGATSADAVKVTKHPPAEWEEYDSVCDADDGRHGIGRFNR